jgi:hypothetical protein
MLGNVSQPRRYLRKSISSSSPDEKERRSNSIDEKRTDGRRSIASEAEVADLLFDPNQERFSESPRATLKSKYPAPMEIDPEESGLGESEKDESYGSSSPMRPADSQTPSFAVAPPQSRSSDSIAEDFLNAPRILDRLYPPGRDDARRIKLAAFLKSPEYVNSLPEDPQMLMPFVAKLPNGMHECTICRYQQKRTDRILSHFRRHVNHRPYPCDGSCGHQKWCVGLYYWLILLILTSVVFDSLPRISCLRTRT